jgi:hypothetical protein
MTYLREQEVLAWHWHTTGPDGAEQTWGHLGANARDKFETICTIPELGVDYVYVVVNRFINGQNHRYVERFANRASSSPILTPFLDAYVSHSGPGTVFTGLSHLEGEQVMVVGDGNVFGPYRVTGGQIDVTADAPTGFITAFIGLPYTSELETLDLYIPGVSVRSNVKNLFRISFEVVDSRGLWFGSNWNNLKQWKPRSVDDQYQPPGPFTGLDHVRFPSTYGHDARACFRQSDPLPVTLIGLGRDVDVGGD